MKTLLAFGIAVPPAPAEAPLSTEHRHERQVLTKGKTMKALTIVFLCTVTAAYSQEVDGLFLSDRQVLTFEMTVPVEMSADEIFKRSKGWFVEYFRSAKDVVRGEVEPSLIKGTFITSYPAALGMWQDYRNDITVRIKDGAIRVTIDNLQTVGGGPIESVAVKANGRLRTGSLYVKVYQGIEDKSRQLVDDLHAYLLTQNNDW